ncbi:hypothetical protein C8Q76DRAFT_789269 [Earliella scabrosa]|nr:hypothetical protein C8Q76DRAFT_789269 [Earliella scabrosa]
MSPPTPTASPLTADALTHWSTDALRCFLRYCLGTSRLTGDLKSREQVVQRILGLDLTLDWQQVRFWVQHDEEPPAKCSEDADGRRLLAARALYFTHAKKLIDLPPDPEGIVPSSSMGIDPQLTLKDARRGLGYSAQPEAPDYGEIAVQHQAHSAAVLEEPLYLTLAGPAVAGLPQTADALGEVEPVPDDSARRTRPSIDADVRGRQVQSGLPPGESIQDAGLQSSAPPSVIAPAVVSTMAGGSVGGAVPAPSGPPSTGPIDPPQPVFAPPVGPPPRLPQTASWRLGGAFPTYGSPGDPAMALREDREAYHRAIMNAIENFGFLDSLPAPTPPPIGHIPTVPEWMNATDPLWPYRGQVGAAWALATASSAESRGPPPNMLHSRTRIAVTTRDVRRGQVVSPALATLVILHRVPVYYDARRRTFAANAIELVQALKNSVAVMTANAYICSPVVVRDTPAWLHCLAAVDERGDWAFTKKTPNVSVSLMRSDALDSSPVVRDVAFAVELHIVHSESPIISKRLQLAQAKRARSPGNLEPPDEGTRKSRKLSQPPRKPEGSSATIHLAVQPAPPALEDEHSKSHAITPVDVDSDNPYDHIEDWDGPGYVDIDGDDEKVVPSRTPHSPPHITAPRYRSLPPSSDGGSSEDEGQSERDEKYVESQADDQSYRASESSSEGDGEGGLDYLEEDQMKYRPFNDAPRLQDFELSGGGKDGARAPIYVISSDEGPEDPVAIDQYAWLTEHFPKDCSFWPAIIDIRAAQSVDRGFRPPPTMLWWVASINQMSILCNSDPDLPHASAGRTLSAAVLGKFLNHHKDWVQKAIRCGEWAKQANDNPAIAAALKKIRAKRKAIGIKSLFMLLSKAAKAGDDDARVQPSKHKAAPTRTLAARSPSPPAHPPSPRPGPSRKTVDAPKKRSGTGVSSKPATAGPSTAPTNASKKPSVAAAKAPRDAPPVHTDPSSKKDKGKARAAPEGRGARTDNDSRPAKSHGVGEGRADRHHRRVPAALPREADLE